MTATINASTSSGVVITPDNSGAIALQNAGTTGLNITASGQVTLPVQPGFLASRNLGNQTSGAIVFNSVVYNIGSAYNSSTGVFTAPIAGRYLICFQGITPSGAGSCYLNLLVNGSATGISSYANQSTGYGNLSFSVIYQLNANDQVTITANGGGVYAAGDGGNPRFSMILMA